MFYKLGEVVTIKYKAIGRTLGLIDLELTPVKPDKTAVTAVTFTELSEGFYEASFAFDVVGSWYYKIKSATNGDNIGKAIEVKQYDVQDVYAKAITIDGKTDTIITNQGTIVSKLDTNSGKLDSALSKLDSIDSQIVDGGYIL